LTIVVYLKLQRWINVLYFCRQIRFHPEGSCLFSGGKDLMKVYGWEPSKCYDSIPLGWGEVADMAVTQNQLVK